MAPRALWKGDLKLANIECPVALYAAASSAERISFHIVNRKTGNRVRREYVDEESGKPVSEDDKVKGFDVGNDTFVTIEPDEVSDLVPANDKTLSVRRFVKNSDMDALFFDRPYYLGPDKGAEEEFALIRESLAAEDIHELLRAWELKHRHRAAECVTQHTLFRKETRWPGYYYRGDAMKVDDANWHVLTVSRRDPKTGEYTMEKAPCYHLVGADEK